MRGVIGAGFLAAALLAFGPAAADDEGAAIRDVIARQLERFAADDWEGAFAFAAPGIQRLFRTPEGFGRMVREGYPMVWRPRAADPGPLLDTPEGPVQIMRFTDADGAAHEAEYLMTLVEGRWRIAGVRMRRLPDLSA